MNSKAWIAAAFVFLIGLGVTTAKALSPKPEPGRITLSKTNTISLDDEINGMTVATALQQAYKLDAALPKGDPIFVVVYSPGGSIQDGLEFIDQMNGLGRPVHTITIFAASMGFQIVQGLGTRYITPFGTLMSHKAKGGFQGEFPGQLDSRYEYYKKRLNEVDGITVRRSGGKFTLAQYQAMYENEYWVDGFNAVKEGFADTLGNVKCDSTLTGSKFREVDFLGMTLKVEFSECPMITGPLSIKVSIPTDRGFMTVDAFRAAGGTLNNITTVDAAGKPVPRNLLIGLTNEILEQKVQEYRKSLKLERNSVIRGY